MLATTTSVRGSWSRSTSTRRASISTPFALAVAVATSTASRSRSTACTGANPSRTAAIATTPEPHPASSRLPRSSLASSSMHARVVGCAPVPNARPGSTTTELSPSGAGNHGGPIQSPPACTGRWNSFQRSSHPGRDGLRPDIRERLANDDLAGVVGEDGQLDDPARPTRSSSPSGNRSRSHAVAISTSRCGTRNATLRRPLSAARSSGG